MTTENNKTKLYPMVFRLYHFVTLILLFLLIMLAPSSVSAICYADYCSDYGQSRTHYLTVSSGTYSFEIEGIGWYKWTEWYIGNSSSYPVETENSGVYFDPSFTRTFSSGTTVVRAEIYNNSWNWEEAHRWYVTVDTTPPSVPSLLSPASGTETNDSTVSLDWSTSSDSGTGVDYYEVQVDNSSSFTSPEFNATPSSSNNTTSSLSDGLYYWRVRARDNATNWSSWSSSRTFRVDRTTPSVPTLQTPSNGSSTSDQTPYFNWTISSDSGSGVNHYEIEIYDWDITWGDIADTTTSSNYTPSVNIPFDRIYWRVRAVDDAGNISAWSSEWWFDLVNNPPTIPGRLWIEGVTNNSVTIHWGGSTDPEVDPIYYEIQYRIHIALDVLDPWLTQILSTTNSIITLNNLTSNTKYDVRVRAVDDRGGESDWNRKEGLFKTREYAVTPTNINGDFEYSPEFGEATDPDTLLENRIPVILVHGNNGDQKPNSLNYWYWWITEYFNNITNSGQFKVFRYVYDSSRQINENGADFAAFLSNFSEFSDRKVVIMVHSMGGLVVRYALNTNTELRDKTIKLITLGTPHLGSPLANPPWVYMTAEPYLDEEVVEWMFEHAFNGTAGDFGLSWYDRNEVPTNVSNYVNEVLLDFSFDTQLLNNSMTTPFTGTDDMTSSSSDAYILAFGGDLLYEVDGMIEDLSLPVDIWNEVHTAVISDHNGLFFFSNPVLSAVYKSDNSTYFTENDGLVPLESALLESHPEIEGINLTDTLNESVDHSSYLDVPIIMDYIMSRIIDLGTTIHPVIPSPLLPADETTISTLTPQFVWTHFQHGGDGETQAGYQIRVCCDDCGDTIVYDTGFIADISGNSHTYSPGAYTGIDPITGETRVSAILEWGGHYHWHVRYQDDGGEWSEWSADDPNPHQDFYTNTHTLNIISGPSASPNPVSSDGTANMTVTASDSLGHGLSYAWTASCPGLVSNGSFNNPIAQNPVWTTPENATGSQQNCTIQVTVSDGYGLSDSGSFAQFVNTNAIETNCSDSIDNDSDGDTDCADQDCNGISGCEYGTELSCFDGIDNDSDSLLDCADTNCDGQTNGPCITGQLGICGAGTLTCSNNAEECLPDNQPQIEGPAGDQTCSDTLDNDCDGDTDNQDSDCQCEFSLDDFTDGVIDTLIWENIPSGNTSGSGAMTYFLEQNNRLEAQASRHWTSSSNRVTNILQTIEGSQGDFIGQDTIIESQVYWYSDTLINGTPPDSIARVSIYDGVNEVIIWTAPQEPWTSGISHGLRTAAAERDNLMRFEFNTLNNTVTFKEDGNLIGTFDISHLNAWRIRWYTSGQNFQTSHTSTVRVYISSFKISGGEPEGSAYGNCGDGLDNDCDGQVDTDPECIIPPEDCFDGIDNNSNGLIDCEEPSCDGVTNGWCDTSLLGICQDGTLTCTRGLEVCSQDNQPQPEGPPGDSTCSDSLDNNCDGLIDNSDPNCQSCADNDSDGYGDPGDPSCPNGGAIDCDDDDFSVNPGASEVCNGLDDNCDGSIDESGACEIAYSYVEDSYTCNPENPRNSCKAWPEYVARWNDPDYYDAGERGSFGHIESHPYCQSYILSGYQDGGGSRCSSPTYAEINLNGVEVAQWSLTQSGGDNNGNFSIDVTNVVQGRSTNSVHLITQSIHAQIDDSGSCGTHINNLKLASMNCYFCNDVDSDSVCSDIDNCPDIANSNQDDADGDNIGDACDDCTDADNDGYGVGTNISGCPLSTSAIDCDDHDQAINPNATEVCNSFDDNCDGSVDETGNALCDNGFYCDGQETCGGVSECQSGTPIDCNDGVGCTDDSCNELTVSCDNLPNDTYCVDDGQFCTGVEYCDPINDCISEGDPCLTGDSCNENTDTCEGTGETNCSDSIDNDNDGNTDCADQDCDGILDCEYGVELSCFDGVDNDNDGLTDCADPDCAVVSNSSVFDQFEDGVIDTNLWAAGGRTFDAFGGGAWNYENVEIVDITDGYLSNHVWGPVSGLTYGAESWVRTNYDFNDARYHTVNFEWEPAFNVSDYHVNAFYIQVTDGYLIEPTDHNLFWQQSDYPGTSDLLWDTDSNWKGWVFENESSPGKLNWSITITPLGIARLYDAPNASGLLMKEEPLELAYPWYIRFMVSDGTSSGFPAGDAWLNLYDFSAFNSCDTDEIVNWNGDLNGDENVDISDVILVLRIALGLDANLPCADINGDGIVDISDVILTLRMALGLDELQNCNGGI